ncbi:MAG: TlpA disulfide reductase family protein [Anaerolineae bacterium]
MANSISKHKKGAFRYSSKKQAAAAPSKKLLYVNVALAVVLILAGVAVLFWLGQQSSQGTQAAPPPGGILPGQTAPNFSLTTLQGEPVQLSDYAGQVVMVNMWATWCPPCKAELPTIDAFYQEHSADGFVVLAVNSQEAQSTVNTFISSTGFTFPVLLDSRGDVMGQYSVRALPTSFIIDRDGTVRHIHTGEVSREQLAQYVEPLL